MGELSRFFFAMAGASAAGFSLGTIGCLVHASIRGLPVELFLYRVSLVALSIVGTFASVGAAISLAGH